jgi:uncharacterized RDD family membrane protein YckC
MPHDLQKASMWKRISAYIFDTILIIMIAVGIAFLLSSLFKYDSYTEERARLRQSFEAEHAVSFDLSQEEYEKLPEGERERIDSAYTAFATDPRVNRIDVTVVNLSLIIIVFSILVPFIIFEMLIPLALGHGRTLGKKIFGIAVVRVDAVKISVFQLFVRSILGKYTLETMIPIFLILLLLFNFVPVIALAGLAVLLFTQIGFLMFSQHHAPIHDMIAGTTAVDYASQRIFESAEELLEYKKQAHAEAAERAEYR